MEIEVTRIDGALRINPAPPYLLSYLQYTKRGFKMERFQMVNDYQKRLLYTPFDEGGVITFPGFFNKIQKSILSNDDTMKVVDTRTPMPPADLEAIANIDWASIGSTGLRPYQIEPVNTLLSKAQDTSGLVVAAGGMGKSIIMAVTYAAFSSLKHVIIAIPLRSVFDQTFKKFVKLFPDKHIGRVGGGFNDISDDVTFTTFASLGNCPIEKCQMLLADEVQSTTGDKILSTLTQMHPIRMFGYTATDKELFNGGDKLLVGLFGERLVHIPYQEAQSEGAVVPCVVYFVKMPESELMVDANSIQGKMVKGIKRCKTRNKLIGEVCRHIPDNWQTLIFVDHIEDHLIPLHREMPTGTKYLHRGTSKKELGVYALSNKEQDEVGEQFKNNEFQFLLVTDAFRAGYDIPNCRVIVQGAGGTSSVEIQQEALRGSRTLPDWMQRELNVEPKTHFVLVDFIDSHDPVLENMSYKRMETYRKQGWVIREVNHPSEINWRDFQPNQMKLL